METKKYISILTIPELDDASYREARRFFFAYKDKHVITGGLFDEKVWALTDEYANFSFNFDFSEDDFKEYGNFLNMSVEEFVKYLKVYVIYRMGELALVSLQELIAQLRHVLQYPIKKLHDIADNYYIDRITSISEFFSVLPADGREDAIATIINELDAADEKFRSTSKCVQRKLATFDSYFKFNDIIESFWAESNDESEKLFFFPVYLWWRISAIIPMRPREFVLTPRNCLGKRDGSWHLTILKNKLKGGNKTVSYKIEDDYKKNIYQIPDDLAELIQWYIKATDGYAENDLKTLFIADTHYAKWDRCKPYVSRYFTYINLSTCLRYFFEQIVVELYRYSLVYDRESSYLNSNEINYIYLGDTRHLSLINMIAEGATPMVAMMLAGHDDAEVSSHYYTNIANLIECKTYRQYSKLLKGKQSYAISKHISTLKIGEFTTLDNNGRCYSARVSEGDFSDCSKAAGPEGEIGFCQKCPYYRSEGRLFSDSRDLYANEIKAECENLSRIVKQVRSANGNEEDIIQALLKLQNAEYSYQQYLYETMRLEEKMARTKKITTEQLIGLIDQYAFDHPREKITIPALSNYICEKGFDVAAYLIRRDETAREYIDKLNAQDNEEMQRSVVTYHQLDIEKFFSTNGTREKMKAALAQRDAYHASIASSAAKAFEENKELKASIEYYRKTNEELKAKLEEKTQKTENKAIREREAVIRRLKKLLDDYVYPEVANQLLVKEGLLETVSEIINRESLAAITVEPSTDISKVSFQSVEDLMKDFDD